MSKSSYKVKVMERRKLKREKLRPESHMKRRKNWQTSAKRKTCAKSASVKKKKLLKTMKTRFKNCGKTVYITSIIKEFSPL